MIDLCRCSQIGVCRGYVSGIDLYYRRYMGIYRGDI